jgi:hypothetical protein
LVARNVVTTTTVEPASATRPTAVSLEPKKTPRRGTAASELRIVPDEYSVLTASTPKMTSASRPRRIALRPDPIGSKLARSAASRSA